MLITGPDPNTMLEKLQKYVKAAVSWADEAGLDFGAAKSKYVIFYQGVTAAKFPKITTKVKVKGEAIERVEEMKYLGIILDHKLSWKKHIIEKDKKARKHIFILRKLIYNKLGPNPAILKWAYEAIIRPAITYGCHVWGNKMMLEIQKKLEKLNRLGCLLIANVWKSAPSKGLKMIYNIKPLDLYVKQLALCTRWRTANMVKKEWSAKTKTDNSHLCILDEELKKLEIVPKRTPFTYRNLDLNFKIPSFETTGDNTDELDRVYYFYTDGLKTDDKSGYGYAIYKAGSVLMTRKYKMGPKNSVFQYWKQSQI